MTEIEVTIFASLLLITRLVSVYLVTTVAVQQARIWHKVKKSGAKEKASIFRVLLFILAIAMLLNNLIPLAIDLVAINGMEGIILEFSSLSDSLILQYFTSNAMFDLIISGIVWLLYREARKYS